MTEDRELTTDADNAPAGRQDDARDQTDLAVEADPNDAQAGPIEHTDDQGPIETNLPEQAEPDESEPTEVDSAEADEQDAESDAEDGIETDEQDGVEADDAESDGGDTEDGEPGIEPEDDEFEPTMESVVEAVLFASDEPLTDGRLAAIVETTPGQIRQAIKALNAKYRSNNTAFRIDRIAGGCQMMTLSPYNHWLKKMVNVRSDSKLSPAALETLAIIAYRQPIIRADIEVIRGVAVGEVIRSLMYKGLVKIVGRAEILGRPMLYGTTKKFLQVFGLNNLKDLPKIEELKQPTDTDRPQDSTEPTDEVAGQVQDNRDQPEESSQSRIDEPRPRDSEQDSDSPNELDTGESGETVDEYDEPGEMPDAAVDELDEDDERLRQATEQAGERASAAGDGAGEVDGGREGDDAGIGELDERPARPEPEF